MIWCRRTQSKLLLITAAKFKLKSQFNWSLKAQRVVFVSEIRNNLHPSYTRFKGQFGQLLNGPLILSFILYPRILNYAFVQKDTKWTTSTDFENTLIFVFFYRKHQFRFPFLRLIKNFKFFNKEEIKATNHMWCNRI